MVSWKAEGPPGWWPTPNGPSYLCAVPSWSAVTWNEDRSTHCRGCPSLRNCSPNIHTRYWPSYAAHRARVGRYGRGLSCVDASGAGTTFVAKTPEWDGYISVFLVLLSQKKNVTGEPHPDACESARVLALCWKGETRIFTLSRSSASCRSKRQSREACLPRVPRPLSASH